MLTFQKGNDLSENWSRMIINIYHGKGMLQKGEDFYQEAKAQGKEELLW